MKKWLESVWEFQSHKQQIMHVNLAIQITHVHVSHVHTCIYALTWTINCVAWNCKREIYRKRKAYMKIQNSYQQHAANLHKVVNNNQFICIYYAEVQYSSKINSEIMYIAKSNRDKLKFFWNYIRNGKCLFK